MLQLSRAKPGNPASGIRTNRRVCVCMCVCILSDGIHVVACGPIGTKFGTHMQIHLQMVALELNKNQLRVTQGGWGGFRGSEIQKSGITTKRVDQLAHNLVHACGFIWEWTWAKTISPSIPRARGHLGGEGG